VSTAPREPERWTRPQDARGAAAATLLLDVARPGVYRSNPFRITGLSTAAGGREVREVRQRSTKTLAVGATVEVVSLLPLPVPARAEKVRGAFDALSDPERRLVNELFWFWSAPGMACECIGSLHEAHDMAVRAHARALDLELAGEPLTGAQCAERDQLWDTAATKWAAVLRRPALWDHVRSRMVTLDDRRLDESTLDALRDALPRALVLPIVELAVAAEDPTRLVAQAARWQPVCAEVHDLVTDAAGPLIDRIDAIADSARRTLGDGDPYQAVAALEAEAVPLLHRVQRLLPQQGDHRVMAAGDHVAIVFNNCATGRVRPGAEKRREWLARAGALATASDTRETIAANAAIRQSSPVVRESDPALRAALKRFGIVWDPELQALADRVERLLGAGRITEVCQIYAGILPHVTDPALAAVLDGFLAANASYRPPIGPVAILFLAAVRTAIGLAFLLWIGSNNGGAWGMTLRVLGVLILARGLHLTWRRFRKYAGRDRWRS